MKSLSWANRLWLNGLPHRWHLHVHIPHFLKASPEPFRGEVLEVGTGHGFSARRILDTYPQVELTAVDQDPAVLHRFKKLKERYGQRLKVKQAQAERLSFDRNSFDFVVALHLLGFTEDPATVIREMIRVVRPGGLIGIADVRRLVGSKSQAVTRQTVEEWAVAEGADLKDSGGANHFFVWAKKPHAFAPQSDSEKSAIL